jgi:hypothetical protein
LSSKFRFSTPIRDPLDFFSQARRQRPVSDGRKVQKPTPPDSSTGLPGDSALQGGNTTRPKTPGSPTASTRGLFAGWRAGYPTTPWTVVVAAPRWGFTLPSCLIRPPSPGLAAAVRELSAGFPVSRGLRLTILGRCAFWNVVSSERPTRKKRPQLCQGRFY